MHAYIEVTDAVTGEIPSLGDVSQRFDSLLYARRLTHALRVSLILLLPAAFEDLSGLHTSKVDDRIQFASVC